MNVNPTFYYAGILIALIAILPMPIEFYTFVRISLCLISFYIVFQMFGASFPIWLIFIGLAILYNPIIPIYLYSKSAWVVINLGTAVAIYIALQSKRAYEMESGFINQGSHDKKQYDSNQTSVNKKNSVENSKKETGDSPDIFEMPSVEKNQETPAPLDQLDPFNSFKDRVELLLAEEYSTRVDNDGSQLLHDLSEKYFYERKNEYDTAMQYMLYQIDLPFNGPGSANSKLVDMHSKTIYSLISKGTAPRSFIIFQLNKFRERHQLNKIY